MHAAAAASAERGQLALTCHAARAFPPQFLIGRNGKPVKRYGPEWSEAIQDDVQAALDIPFEDAEPF